MKGINFKKIIIVFIFSIVVVFAFKLHIHKIQTIQSIPLKEDFVTGLDRNKFYAGTWTSNDPAYDKIFTEEGAIILKNTITDEGPYILTKPIPINWNKPKIIKITRRVKIKPTDNYFAGGLVFYSTMNRDLVPKFTEENPFGDAMFQIEYVKNNLDESTRPGKNVFRVLTPTWEKNNDYIIEEPIYDEWFVEKIIYNDKTGYLSYQIDDRPVQKVPVPKLRKNFFRIRMHNYGYYTGAETSISDLKIEIFDK